MSESFVIVSGLTKLQVLFFVLAGATGFYLASSDSKGNKIRTLITKIVPLTAGMIAVDRNVNWLIWVVLILFIIVHLIGLFSGALRFGIGLLLPIIPVLFIRPWYKGLLVGFIIISAVTFIITAILSLKDGSHYY